METALRNAGKDIILQNRASWIKLVSQVSLHFEAFDWQHVPVIRKSTVKKDTWLIFQ